MPKGQKKILQCLLCSEGYSKPAVFAGKYFIDSGICIECYKKMQNQPASISCFGKLPKGRDFGYSSKHPVCSSICLDRIACATFISKIKHS